MYFFKQILFSKYLYFLFFMYFVILFIYFLNYFTKLQILFDLIIVLKLLFIFI